MVKLTAASSEIEECEIRATLLNDSFVADAFSTPSSSSQLVLHCPACDAETYLGDQFCQDCGSVQPAFETKPRFSPESVKQFVGFNRKHLIGLCAFALGLMTISAVVSFIRLPDELDKTISQNRLNDAAEAAERLFISRFGTLNGRDAQSYSEAFYKRAQVFAKNGNFKLALGDLCKVLPSYSRMPEVAQLKASYQLFLTQGKTVAETNPIAIVEIPSLTRPTKSNDMSQPSQSKPLAARPTQAVAATSAKSVAKAGAAAADGQSSALDNSDKEEVNSEEADMAAYNRHLAEYFSKQDTKETKNSKGSAAKEPPSFNEWVQTGKAEF